MIVRLRQPESLASADIFLYLGHARAHDKKLIVLLNLNTNRCCILVHTRARAQTGLDPNVGQKLTFQLRHARRDWTIQFLNPYENAARACKI